MKYKSLLILSLVAATEQSAMAEPIPEVQAFLKSEITKLATVQPPLAPADGKSLISGYDLSLFRLRVQAEVGFDAGVARVTLVPVAEFFWE